MIHIFDMNNVARRYVEAGGTSGIRELFYQVSYTPGVVLAVWDGAYAKQLRKKLYPAYKERRVLPSEDISKGMELVFELLKQSKTIQFKVKGYEADDVIAQLAGRYAAEGVHIHSTDADFAQLLVLEGIKLDRTEFKAKPDEMRLYKATVGDASDNIPGIKGFGEKSWAQITSFGKQTLEEIASGQSAFDECLHDEGLSTASANWLRENVELFRTFWKIIGFFPVPDETIAAHMTIGVPNPDAVASIFKQFLFQPMKGAA